MAIRHSLCASYLRELLRGAHREQDVYRMALYTSWAEIGPNTARYTPEGEVVGIGYTGGGTLLQGFKTYESDGVAWVDWEEDPVWPESNIVARGAMIYNQTQGWAAVAVLDFGFDRTSSGGFFKVVLPPPTPEAAIIRINLGS